MKKQIQLLLTAALFLVMLVLVGCGNQTEEANQLTREANDIIEEVQPKLVEVEGLLAEAGTLNAAAEQETALLTSAQSLIGEIETGVGKARDKLVAAAKLNIDEQQQDYLEAKIASMDAMLELSGTMRQLTDVLLADPTAQNPATLQQWADLGQTMGDQAVRLQEAEAEAGKILEESGE